MAAKLIAKPETKPTNTSVDVWAFKYNLDDITNPAIVNAMTVGHSNNWLSMALFKGNNIPIMPPIATLCTLTLKKNVRNVENTTKAATITMNLFKLVLKGSLLKNKNVITK